MATSSFHFDQQATRHRRSHCWRRSTNGTASSLPFSLYFPSNALFSIRVCSREVLRTNDVGWTENTWFLSQPIRAVNRLVHISSQLREKLSYLQKRDESARSQLNWPRRFLVESGIRVAHGHGGPRSVLAKGLVLLPSLLALPSVPSFLVFLHLLRFLGSGSVNEGAVREAIVELQNGFESLNDHFH